MKILLDTHSFLWAIAEPNKFSPIASEILIDKNNQLFLSVASMWEVSIKVAINKLTIPELPKFFFPYWMNYLDVDSLKIEPEHSFAVADLPPHHNDPFDRMLIVQAQILNLSIMTTDKIFNQYDVQLIW